MIGQFTSPRKSMLKYFLQDSTAVPGRGEVKMDCHQLVDKKAKQVFYW